MVARSTQQRADQSSRRRSVVHWALILRAVAVLSLGVALLVTGVSRPILGNLLAGYWLVGAVLTLAWVRVHWGQAGSKLALIGGIACVAAAVVGLARLLIQRVLSVDDFLNLLGLSAIVIGSLRLAGALRDDPRPFAHPIRRIVLGLSEIAVGLLIISVNAVTRSMTVGVGIWALLGGTIMLLDARDAGHADRDSERSPPP